MRKLVSIGYIAIALIGASGAMAITATPASAAGTTHLGVTSAASATAGTAINVTVTALTAGNTTDTGYTSTVHFSSADPNATLPADYTFTAGDSGTHIFQVTFKTAGNQSVTATQVGTPGVTGSDNVTVTAGPATHLNPQGPNSTSVAEPAYIQVVALDAFNNRATGYRGTVHWTSSDTAATLPPDHTYTSGDSGLYSYYPIIMNTAGNPTVTVTDTTTPGITGTTSWPVYQPGPTTAFQLSAPASLATGQVASVGVRAVDSAGHTATEYRGTVHFSSTDPNASLKPDYTFTASDAGNNYLQPFSFNTPGSQTLTATDTAHATINGQTNIQVTASGAVTHLGLFGPASASSGQMFTVEVQALDASNHVVAGYTGTVHFTSSDNGATLRNDYTFTAGNAGDVFLAGFALQASGPQTITAADTSTASINGTVNIQVVASGPATHLQVIAPTAVTAGQGTAVEVVALDANDHVASSYLGTAHVTSGDPVATLPPNFTFTAADAGDRHSVPITLRTAGVQSITVTDTTTSTITGTTTTTVSNTVTLTGTTPVNTGASVNVTWSNVPSPTANDWVGLYSSSSAADNAFVAWRYTTGAAGGQVPLPVPAGTPAGTTYQLRLFSNNSFTRLATSNQLTIQQATVTGTTPVNSGAPMAVHWSAVASPTSTDWIGLYGSPSAASTQPLAVVYTNGTAQGTKTLTVPSSAPAGSTYQVRLFTNNTFTVIATGGPLTVQTATVAESPNPVGSGKPLTATWSGIVGPTVADWVGLYTPSTADSAPIAWRYTTGAAAGSVMFTVPAGTPTASNYQLRLFANNTYSRLSTSGPFTIQSAAITESPSPVGTGKQVTATWSNVLTPTANDWVGLYSSPAASDGAFVAWRYTGNTASGAVSFTVPAGVPSGSTYQLRLFTNNTFTRMAVSAPFTVQAATVSETPNPVVQGQALTATWTNILGPTSTDWVGLYASSGAADNAFVAWRYTTGTTSGNAPLVVPAGTTPGATYEVRLFSQNTFARMATSSPFAVAAAATIVNDGFSPSSYSPNPLTIPHGAGVSWANNGPSAHTVTAVTGSAQAFDSGNMAVGQSYLVVFPTAGTYHYYCSIHNPSQSTTGMYGTVTVA